MNKYKNKFERYTGESLDSNKVSFTYESERIPYTITAEYIPDFIITTSKGKKIYLETKGNGRSFDYLARRKLVAVKRDNPDLDIRLVFYSDGKIGPKRKDGSSLRQMEWAERNGFKASVRDVPKEWINE